MQNLVLLIVALLAGGAGWYGGSWKGRDAVQALDKAQQIGQQAVAERDKLAKDLKQNLASMAAEFDKGQKERDAAHAQAKSALDAALASRDKTIVELGRTRDTKQAEIQRLKTLADNTGASAEERAKAQAEIARLKQEVADKDTLIAGFECSKVAVPAKLLLPLQGG